MSTRILHVLPPSERLESFSGRGLLLAARSLSASRRTVPLQSANVQCRVRFRCSGKREKYGLLLVRCASDTLLEALEIGPCFDLRIIICLNLGALWSLLEYHLTRFCR